MGEFTTNPAGEKKSYHFTFCGTGGTLFGIQIVNLFLILITFGVYYFWGKVRVRKYLWGQTDIHGDRLAYHGTGKETFFGWLKAMLIFGIPLLIAQNVPQILGAPLPVTIVCIGISFLLVYLFLPIAIVGMRRYRYSRTSLRGIRFSFRGRWWEFAKTFYWGLFLMFLTLGLYKPYFDMRISAYVMEKSFFGMKGFGFDGRGSDLIKYHIITILLALPTLLVSRVWYGFYTKKYIWNHMTFDTARFQSTITFGGYLWLYITNILLLLCTVGFGAPWVKVRTLRYIMDNLTLEGDLDMAAIVQEAQVSTATGEEIGDFLELDLDLA